MAAARFHRLDDWLAWMETCHPSEIELGLDRIRIVASRLGLLDKKPQIKIITVAGTNGKGTFVGTLEALLLKAGHRVGSYTSPHVVAYNERIKINGVESSDACLCSAFEKLDAVRAEVSLTYFEFSTLAAFLLFSEANLDYWVLEIGMGGRLDAVNIIDPDISVITSISLDHENWLGSTRELIGAEKAGIIRKNGLVVCCDMDPPRIIGEKIAENQARGLFIDREFGYQVTENGLELFVADPTSRRQAFGNLPAPELPLPSVAAAAQVFTLLGLELSADMLGSCLQSLTVAGRFQRVQITDRHQVILDVAHNPAAMQYLSVRLEKLRENGVQIIEIIFAMMRDKNMVDSLRHLVPLVDYWYPVGFAQYPRAADTRELSNVLTQLGVSGDKIQNFSSTADALTARLLVAEDSAQKKVTVVTGSFYPVGEASDFLRKWQQPKLSPSTQEADAWMTD